MSVWNDLLPGRNARAESRPARVATEASVSERVTPVMADLAALSRRAALLPGWERKAQARQSGAYQANMKGRGMEYAESRPYQPGDDVRALDWRLTARSGKPHTKLFREERERPVYVLIDLRPRMAFATKGVFKLVQAARAAALLAWKTVQGGDRIGGILLGAQHCEELAPARGTVAALRLLKRLVAVASPASSHAGPSAEFTAATDRLQRLVKPGSLVFVLGDFRDLSPRARSTLTLLARHNSLMMIACYDSFETAWPNIAEAVQLTAGGRTLELTLGDRGQATDYAARYTQRQSELARYCRESHIALVPMASTDDPLSVLQRALGKVRG